jgi:hypothetical protein
LAKKSEKAVEEAKINNEKKEADKAADLEKIKVNIA